MRYIFCLIAICWISFAPSSAHAQTTAALTAPSAPISATRTGYVLGGGDQVRINVFGENDISGDYLVDAEGNVTLPLIGRVSAAGQTPDGLARSIAAQLATNNFVQNARVTAGMISYRPFYILGEVQKPGAYPYLPNMNAQSAVATAGGYTYRANTRRVFIRRAGETREQRVTTDQIIDVRPGDTIRVGERFF